MKNKNQDQYNVETLKTTILSFFRGSYQKYMKTLIVLF